MVSDLHSEARRRLELGILKYRNHSERFVGDPIVEGRAEVADLWNYAAEARAQKLIGPIRHALLRALAVFAWRLLA